MAHLSLVERHHILTQVRLDKRGSRRRNLTNLLFSHSLTHSNTHSLTQFMSQLSAATNLYLTSTCPLRTQHVQKGSLTHSINQSINQ